MGVKKQLIDELFAPARVHYPRSHVTIKGIFDDLLEADLLDISSHKDRKHRYILTAVDAGSKMGFGVPLKSKSGREVSSAFEKILKNNTFLRPRFLHTDKGREFFNQDFNKVLSKYGIDHYSTFSGVKASLVERFNRSLRHLIWKSMALRGSRTWVRELPSILEVYNHRIHSAHGMRPSEVKKSDEATILQRLFRQPPPPRTSDMPMLRPGDVVRISKSRALFSKASSGSWSNETYKIVKAVNTSYPPYYFLEDFNGQKIQGRFYTEELKKSKYPNDFLVEKILKRKKGAVFVKFLDMGPEHNAWIRDENIFST